METGAGKSTLGQQSSGQHFLTLYKNFTQLRHPLQEKIRLVCISSQFCFIPGEQMSTLWTNGHRGLKSTAWQQSSGQYSLTSHEKFTQLSHPLQGKISQSQHFFTVLLHSRWTNVHFMGKWTQGLKIDLMGQQSSGMYSLTWHKNFTQLSHPLQDKFR